MLTAENWTAGQGNRSVGPWNRRAEGVALVGAIEEFPAVAAVHDMHPSEFPRADGTLTGQARADGCPCCIQTASDSLTVVAAAKGLPKKN